MTTVLNHIGFILRSWSLVRTLPAILIMKFWQCQCLTLCEMMLSEKSQKPEQFPLVLRSLLLLQPWVTTVATKSVGDSEISSYQDGNIRTSLCLAFSGNYLFRNWLVTYKHAIAKHSKWTQTTAYIIALWSSIMHVCIKMVLPWLYTLFIAIDFERLIEDNMGNCNGVLRATACAIRELVLNQTCEVPSSGWSNHSSSL